jgi:glycosyltransferase involved in cell wall biosynthesis
MIQTFEVVDRHSQRSIHPFAGQWEKQHYQLGRPLRVLQVGKFYAPVYGGMETHLKALCDGISPAVQVEAAVSNRSRKSICETIDGIRVRRSGTVVKLAGACVSPGLVRAIRESRADLIHLHLPNPTGILAWIASRNRAPVVVTYHSDIVRQKYLGMAFSPILDYALRRSAAILVTSAEYVRTSPVLSRFQDRCLVIPFGIDLEPFDDPDHAAVSRIRKMYGERIILAVGRLVYYKGLEYMIRAMKDIDAHLLLVGVGPLQPELEREVAEAGVGNRVTFLGPVDDVVAYYHACDVFVLPSVERSESFGLVQLEAMACSKPVVNTHLPTGVPWVSIHGETGLTVKPRSAEMLADAINSLLSNPAHRLLLGRAARRRVEDEFTTGMMLRRTLEAYVLALCGRARSESADGIHAETVDDSAVFALTHATPKLTHAAPKA